MYLFINLIDLLSSLVSSTGTGWSNSIEQGEETIPQTIGAPASRNSHDVAPEPDHHDNDAELDLGEEDSSDNTVGTDTKDESTSVALSLEGDGSVVSTKIDVHAAAVTLLYCHRVLIRAVRGCAAWFPRVAWGNQFPSSSMQIGKQQYTQR